MFNSHSQKQKVISKLVREGIKKEKKKTQSFPPTQHILLSFQRQNLVLQRSHPDNVQRMALSPIYRKCNACYWAVTGKRRLHYEHSKPLTTCTNQRKRRRRRKRWNWMEKKRAVKKEKTHQTRHSIENRLNVIQIADFLHHTLWHNIQRIRWIQVYLYR